MIADDKCLDDATQREGIGALIAALGGKDLEARWRAMDVLAAAGAQSIQPLVAALQNPGAWLNEEDRRRMLQPGQRLTTSSDDPVEFLRWGAQQVLRKIGLPAVGPLSLVLATATPAAARCAAWVLGWTGNQASVAPLLEALSHPAAEVRAGAAAALSRLQSTDAIGPLIAALTDGDADVCCTAADALSELGAQKAVKPLIAALSDPVVWLRCRAARALGKLKALEAAGALAAMLSGDPEPEARIDAAFSLGDMCAQDALLALLNALDDENLGVQRAAAWALGDLRAPEAVQPLITKLRSPWYRLRATAATSLGRIGDPQALPHLERLADDHGCVQFFAPLSGFVTRAIEMIHARAASGT